MEEIVEQQRGTRSSPTIARRAKKRWSSQGERNLGLWSRPLVLILLSSALWSFGFSGFYMLPKYLEQRFGLDPAGIGVYVGLSSCAAMLCTPLLGRLVLKFGLARMFSFGSALMAVASLGYLFVDSPGVFLGFLRVLQGFSWALILTCAGTIVSLVVPAARMGQALALSGASMMIMNALAPPTVEYLSTIFGWDIAFAMGSISAGIATITALTMRFIDREKSTTNDKPVPGFFATLRSPLGIPYGLTIALVAVGFGCAMTFSQPAGLELGRTRVSGFLVAYAGTTIGFRLLFGSFVDRFGRARAMYLSLGVFVLGLGLLAIPVAWMLEPAAIVLGLGHAVFYPAVNALVAEQLTPEERPQMFAVYTAAFNLGMFGGTFLLGKVAASLGFVETFLSAATLVSLAFLVAGKLVPKKKQLLFFPTEVTSLLKGGRRIVN